MNKAKYVDSSIEILKSMLGDESNELGSGGKRALTSAIGKLKKLKRQRNATYGEVFRTVAEVAELVSSAAVGCGRSDFRS